MGGHIIPKRAGCAPVRVRGERPSCKSIWEKPLKTVRLCVVSSLSLSGEALAGLIGNTTLWCVTPFWSGKSILTVQMEPLSKTEPHLKFRPERWALSPHTPSHIACLSSNALGLGTDQCRGVSQNRKQVPDRGKATEITSLSNKLWSCF